MRPAIRNQRDLSAPWPYCGVRPFRPAQTAPAPRPKSAASAPRATSVSVDCIPTCGRAGLGGAWNRFPPTAPSRNPRRNTRQCGDKHPSNASGWPSYGSRTCSAKPIHGISPLRLAAHLPTGRRGESSPATADAPRGLVRSSGVRLPAVKRPATNPARTWPDRSPSSDGRRTGAT